MLLSIFYHTYIPKATQGNQPTIKIKRSITTVLFIMDHILWSLSTSINYKDEIACNLINNDQLSQPKESDIKF